MVTEAEEIEAQEANYTLETGAIIMSGHVLLSQGRNLLSGDQLFVDLEAATGRMEGNVRTTFQSGQN